MILSTVHQLTVIFDSIETTLGCFKTCIGLDDGIVNLTQQDIIEDAIIKADDSNLTFVKNAS